MHVSTVIRVIADYTHNFLTYVCQTHINLQVGFLKFVTIVRDLLLLEQSMSLSTNVDFLLFFWIEDVIKAVECIIFITFAPFLVL